MGMRRQALGVRQPPDGVRQCLCTGAVGIKHAAAFDEMLHAERRGKARRAGGGQDMVGAGEIVAKPCGGCAGYGRLTGGGFSKMAAADHFFFWRAISSGVFPSLVVGRR